MSLHSKNKGNVVHKLQNKYIHLRGRPYIHTCQSYVYTLRDIPRTSHLYRKIGQRAGQGRFVQFLASVEQRSQKWKIPFFGRQ